MHVCSDDLLVKIAMDNRVKTLLACVEGDRSICTILSLTLLSNGLDSNSWPDYEEEGVGLCKNLKITYIHKIAL